MGSSCSCPPQIATGGLTNPDEAINLAAAGWQHIIATLWTVYDTTAAHITTGMYPTSCATATLTPPTTAQALHHTIRHYRDQHPYQLSRWASFLHTGP